MDDSQAFAQAMSGVQPLEDSGAKVRLPDQEAPPVRLDKQVDDDLEVMAQLADLIEGDDLLDLRLTGQFSYGASPGVSQALLERLAEGDFPIQDYLDLHGLGVDEGMAEVERFLAQAAARGLRSVLIVHGKGKGSPMGIPLLKNQLEKALCNKRYQRRILAFCTARPVDGGSGAMYVLLRKWSGPKGTAWPAH
jgi:DNA-nicking Smr family endonuclease